MYLVGFDNSKKKQFQSK